MDRSGDIGRSKTGGTLVQSQPIVDRLAEIKHPLSAIVANADAARRWLNRREPNFHEAIAALDRIVKESARIDQTLAAVRTGAAECDAGPANIVLSSFAGPHGG